MTERPLLIDLYCGPGGTSVGYWEAGFEVIGVDSKQQPSYPFAFILADTFDPAVFRLLLAADAVAASPPCQHYSRAAGRWSNQESHPALIPPTRNLLLATELPYIMENVEGAPLIDPVRICATAFGRRLRIVRHRLFESNIPLKGTSCHHVRSDYFSVFSHGGKLVRARGGSGIPGYIPRDTTAKHMGTPWMRNEEMSQAIPPYSTRYLGRQLLRAIGRPAVRPRRF